MDVTFFWALKGSFPCDLINSNRFFDVFLTKKGVQSFNFMRFLELCLFILLEC